MAERQLPKLNVAGSIPVSRSNLSSILQLVPNSSKSYRGRLISPASNWRLHHPFIVFAAHFGLTRVKLGLCL